MVDQVSDVRGFGSEGTNTDPCIKSGEFRDIRLLCRPCPGGAMEPISLIFAMLHCVVGDSGLFRSSSSQTGIRAFRDVISGFFWRVTQVPVFSVAC